MEQVKAFFGFLLLGVAVWMLERILPGAVIMLLWALLAVALGVFFGALTALPGSASIWRQLSRALGVVTLAWIWLRQTMVAQRALDALVKRELLLGELAKHPVEVTSEEVQAQLGGRIELILDGGPCVGGVPSTILDMTMRPPRVIRRGIISEDNLREILE